MKSDAPMNGPPMSISLMDNAIPSHICTAHQIPKHLQDEIVDELLEKDIIECIKEPTQWTSLAFFIPKLNAKGPRSKKNRTIHLVTDLSKLNCFIIRPTHPFPSAQTILASIKSSSKVFIKLDAIQSYHQVALNTPSSLLTTFLLPSRHYWYHWAPMGLCSSSDEWCCHSNVTIENVPGVCKLVDDYLISGDDIHQTADHACLVLEKCRKQGISISKHKFEIGDNVSFAGYILSPPVFLSRPFEDKSHYWLSNA